MVTFKSNADKSLIPCSFPQLLLSFVYPCNKRFLSMADDTLNGINVHIYVVSDYVHYIFLHQTDHLPFTMHSDMHIYVRCSPSTIYLQLSIMGCKIPNISSVAVIPHYWMHVATEPWARLKIHQTLN